MPNLSANAAITGSLWIVSLQGVISPFLSISLQAGNCSNTHHIINNDPSCQRRLDIHSVMNNLPVADAGGPYTGFVNESVTFNGSGSSDSDGNITNYTWDFGDGNVRYDMVTNHSYNSIG
ncbi:MAG: PKD domain-containing protein [ANME-2 cluster archaeon]|nr:MAG: PKD domain-containing protein [ANME-2 cluster archaeon]